MLWCIFTFDIDIAPGFFLNPIYHIAAIMFDYISHTES